MRYICLDEVLRAIFGNPIAQKERRLLFDAHLRVVGKTPAERQDYIQRYGRRWWSPVKRRLTNAVGKKCWYTESEAVGFPLAIDHFRPSVLYWFLAFEPTNYRVSCAFSNSSELNETVGQVGGKDEHFPLLGSEVRARGRNHIRFEKPLLLDPCNERDCDLLAFREDGVPVLNPQYAKDPDAERRVEETKIILNLSHPDFNSKREQLYHDINDDVETYEEAQPESRARASVLRRMRKRLAPETAFSTAAVYYLRRYRYLGWVEGLLAGD